MPVYISSCALGRLAHPDGELNLVRAAHSGGIIQLAPTMASCTVEEMAAARAPGQVQFFQLYVNSDRKQCEDLLRKADVRPAVSPFAVRRNAAADEHGRSGLGTCSTSWEKGSWQQRCTLSSANMLATSRHYGASK